MNGAARLLSKNHWYHVQVKFSPLSRAVRVSLNGMYLGERTIPVNMLGASDGPQIGMYSFDYHGQMWPDSDLKLWINNACVGEASTSCTSDGGGSSPTPKPPPSPEPQPEPTNEPAPEPEPEPTTEPEPEPEPEIEPVTCEDLNARRNLTDAGEQCNSYADRLHCNQGFISRAHWAIPCVWTGCGCFADGVNLLDCQPLATPVPTALPICAAKKRSKWTDKTCEKKCNKEGNCNKKCRKQCSAECKCASDRRLQSIVLV